MKISVEANPTQADKDAVLALLNAHNGRFGIEWEQRPLAVFAKDEDGKVIGGLSGYTLWNWLKIEILAVSPDIRTKGLGRSLIEQAENEARSRGCQFSFLDTFSFQARPFYERLGYKLYGELPDFPTGHFRYFMTKTL